MNVVLSLTLALIICLTLISHPVTFIFLMIGYTTLIAILVSSTFFTFWYGYTLMLVFLGGMLILFLYIASIAPNEIFPMLSPLNMVPPLMISLFVLAFMFHDYPQVVNYNLWQTPMNTIMKLYSQNHFITLFLIMYLLMTLLVVVKITNIFKGPLRSTYDKTSTS